MGQITFSSSFCETLPKSKDIHGSLLSAAGDNQIWMKRICKRRELHRPDRQSKLPELTETFSSSRGLVGDARKDVREPRSRSSHSFSFPNACMTYFIMPRSQRQHVNQLDPRAGWHTSYESMKLRVALECSEPSSAAIIFNYFLRFLSGARNARLRFRTDDVAELLFLHNSLN